MLIATIWLACWMVTWPALLASFQGDYGPAFNTRYYRKDLAAAMGFALLPPTWILTPFLTGFYEHGFQFGRKVAA